MTLVLDNTVLSNFALAKQVDRLQHFAAEGLATSEATWRELQSGINLGRVPEADWSWLSVLPLRDDEEALIRTGLPGLGRGEATCIALAYLRGLRFATDDRLARRTARRLGIPLTGTLGLLIALVEEQAISRDEGNHILQQMIEHGYRCPVEHL